MTPADRSRILVVLHQEHSTPGRVGLRLVERGYQLDIRRPRFGDPLPGSLADYAGAVFFGGPMSAIDPDDYILQETDWIKVPLDEGAPFLGLCLGAQMMARHLGAAVTANPDGSVEVGYYPLWPTAAGRRRRWTRAGHRWARRRRPSPAPPTIGVFSRRANRER